MQRRIERLRNKLACLGVVHRRAVSGVVVFAALFAFIAAMLSINVVTVTASDGTSHTLLTTSEEPQQIVEMAGVVTTENDEIVYTAYGDDGATILINREFPVNIRVDGGEKQVTMEEGTVAEALAAAGVEVGEHDVVEPALDTQVARSMEEIKVARVTYDEYSIRSEVLDEEVEAYLATREGGADGFEYSSSRIYDVTFQDKLQDGEVVEKKVLALTAVYHPYDAPSPGFEPGVPVSSIDRFVGVEIGEDGVPTSYTRKMEGAIATAYSASGGYGAGGHGLYCGTVAVNPNVIPYGTRMYITAADGSFVYGYAIASDTGTAMMDGYVDVDLYFESNAECMQFGKHALDIYIFD